MKSALIVGGDRLTGIKQILSRHGIEEITHWSGRKPGAIRQIIPRNTELVVILTDWISHALAEKVKRSAHALGLEILYTRGSGGSLDMSLFTPSHSLRM